eukprot:UN25469
MLVRDGECVQYFNEDFYVKAKFHNNPCSDYESSTVECPTYFYGEYSDLSSHCWCATFSNSPTLYYDDSTNTWSGKLACKRCEGYYCAECHDSYVMQGTYCVDQSSTTTTSSSQDCPDFCTQAWVGDSVCDESDCMLCPHFYNGDMFDGGDCNNDDYSSSMADESECPTYFDGVIENLATECSCITHSIQFDFEKT